MRLSLLIPIAFLVFGAGCAHTPSSTPFTHAGAASALPRPIEVPPIRHPEGETPAWWFRAGAAQAAERGATQGRAKNVILFLGDGMSLTTVAAARILDGQRKGQPGEENLLSWERFPHTGFSKTYNTDTQTPDSAGTMSAIATGVKTRAGVLSIGQSAERGDCEAALRAPMLSLWELAASSGLATGVVTTTRVTHATPAATFAHSANRNWENDTDLSRRAANAGCIDIARQFVETPYGRGPDVLLGGGRVHFLPKGSRDPEYGQESGQREDGRDLIAEWKRRHRDGNYVWNAEQLAAAPTTGPLLGLFEPSHMQFSHDRAKDRAGEPTLADMTRAAIERLRRNPKGYLLLVEGGRIDHAHHYGNAYRALTDTIALSEAVAAATEMTSDQDTLILVTADHSHTLTFAGYPVRGNSILGKVKGTSGEGSDQTGYATDATNQTYTTLGYANGPGYTGASREQPEGAKRYPHEGRDYREAQGGRANLAQVNTEDPDYLQEATIPLSNETHGGEDVGIWAHGPGAHAVRGTIEQNAIFHVLLQATPTLRERLCAAGLCNEDGVPVRLPDPARFRSH